MKTYKQFLVESSLERKIIQGHGKDPISIPGTTVFHHDPVAGLTVYHALEPRGLKLLSTDMGLCTSSNPHFQHAYLYNGNTFMIHKNKKRVMFYNPLNNNAHEEENSENFNNEGLHKLIGKEVLSKMRNEPHRTKHVPEYNSIEKTKNEDI